LYCENELEKGRLKKDPKVTEVKDVFTFRHKFFDSTDTFSHNNWMEGEVMGSSGVLRRTWV
jgi:hypothetical protein